MGKPTGFLEYRRKQNASVAPKERIRSFEEFHPLQPREERRRQAARCMNCGVPFCQSGAEFGGMISGCPLHNLIPEWNDEIYNDHYDEALSRLTKTNNFPEFTGRVCPALCEAACTCALNGEAVTVRDNELAVIETAFAGGKVLPQQPPLRSGKTVAVVGSGPAGLAVADDLNRRGHTVTVFEREALAGGLLTYGIPNMKLDKAVVARRVALMEASGILFCTGCEVDAAKAAELQESFDAVVIACGAKKPRDLRVAGRSASGVLFAVDYLTDSTKALLSKTPPSTTANGKHVIVVGGGDTGNDCVGTAIRQGCADVVQLEMMDKLPDTRTPQNPWPQWPRVCKTDYGQEEAIACFGSDPRRYLTTVKEIIEGEDGSICAVKTVRLRFEKNKKTGRFEPLEVDGSEETLPCELLLIAAGFVGCEDGVFAAFGIEPTAKGTLPTEKDSYRIGRKLFAAGDARRGQSLVVHAIAEGKGAALEIDRFLLSEY